MHNKRRQGNMGGNGGGGGHRHHNNRPRRYSGNRPQGSESGGGDAASIARTRRNATQSRDKYQMMAHDATRSGDRVLAEYYLQHADHFHRVLLALPPEEVRQQQFQPRNFNEQGQPTAEGQQPQSNEPEAPAAAHGLPSFITQPLNPNPEE